MCLEPLIAGLEPTYTDDGELKYKVHLGVSSALLHPEWRQIQIPCGDCVECMQASAEAWSYRCMNEASLYKNSCFITLTYHPQFVPVEGVQKRDLQLFIKRLRKHFNGVRYFAVGEYGSRTGRPHYHACLFNCAFPDRYFFRQDNRGNLLSRSPLLERLWPLGFSSIGEVTKDTAKYCAKYLQKLSPLPEGFNKPFLLMSRKPGIGFGFVTEKILETDKLYSKGGYIAPPRYYLQVLEKQGISVSDVRDKRAIKAELVKSSPERIEDKKQHFTDIFGTWRKKEK